ncbi:MAG: hypothetical protein AAF704_18780 [Cyanobacteria bacterium P01_D01_bin.123]
MSESKNCVVVFGPGRSGTSLGMKLLEASGLRLSAELEPASRDNPTGHYEDVRICKAQQRLMTSIGLYPLLPRPEHWKSAPAYSETKQELKNIVKEEVNRDRRLWGFKDPRTCVFWPLWEDIFKELQVIPKVVFCVRSSNSTVSSLMKAYNLPQDLSEGILLYRSLHALRDLQGQNVCFVHYDRWQTDPVLQLKALTTHCGLANSATDVEAIARRNIRPELSREAGNDLRLSSSLVELDRLLASCDGSSCNADRLETWCHSLTKSMDDLGFVLKGVDRLYRMNGRRLFHAAETKRGRLARIKAAVRHWLG